MTKFRLRTLLGVFAIFAVLAFAVACGDDDDDDNGTPGGPTPGTSEPAAPSGTITAQSFQFEQWDPHLSDFSQDINHFFKVWRGLYEFDKDQQPIPSMADGDPQVSSDGKTYTIKLKPDLKWSDGQPLEAEDFVLGIQRTCNPDIAGNYQYLLTAVEGCDDYATGEGSLEEVGVRAVDATTIEIKLQTAQPTFPIILAMWPTFPVPKHKVATVDADWPGPMENVYNGPFMPSAYVENDRMELVPNPNWAGSEKPKVEKIILRYIDDAAVANNAYRSGELDVAIANTTQLAVLRSEFPDELISYPSTSTLGLEFQLSKPIWAKKEVRLAFSQATDRETLNDVILQGANQPTTAWMAPDRSGVPEGTYDSVTGFDPAKAKANMEKAGYPNGAGFPGFTLLLTESASNKAVGEFLKEEWKKYLNIDVELQFVDTRTRSARFNAKDFDMVIGGWGEDYPDPENWMVGLWETDGSINKTSTSVKEIDDLIARAKYNTNDEERRQLYRDAEKILIEGVYGIAPLYHRANHFLVKPYIKGMRENAVPNDSTSGGQPAGWNPEFWSTTKN